ncbi:Cyclic nucleotide-binding domain-containing protein [Sulfidibacter corallicola]|uniref:Cyclic nucleotide-binding domain-containing protein n=1 Tax=Sulfidibacter corallicola TaxID=2818388 RepID=A0A8A4TT73_SULCO|nr:cyclic nucleotide-binding domain-containing protein [Sulfidibacter corallicola]QTD53159.1 cyclic nucleotide-binding domain-containing protein [Sulfidibacter corallicola]
MANMNYDLYSQIESFNTKLTMNTLQFLMKCGELKKVPKGEVISNEGDPSDTVYIIVEGTASVEKTDPFGNRNRLATVRSGALLGEMGVFLNMKRSATIVAHSDMTLIEFTNQNFINALPKTPDITVRLLKSLADKINVINQKYTDLMMKNTVLVLGIYILSSAAQGSDPEVTVVLDTHVVLRQTHISAKRIKSVLNVFLKNELIGKWKVKDNQLHFRVKVAEMRGFLKGLSGAL